MSEKIARCRVVFSAFVTMAVLLSPTQPVLNPWITLLGDALPMEPNLLGTVCLHLAYSVVIYALVSLRPDRWAKVGDLAIWGDVAFGAMIAFLTEGKSSLFGLFFVFASISAGIQWGQRRALTVAAVSVLWIGFMLVLAPSNWHLHVMRPVYLLIIAYLVGYLGEQRLRLEAEVRSRDLSQERTAIARELHDSYLQVLAAVNLQIESCRQLLRNGKNGAIEDELVELQQAVNAEQDDLRSYLRSLVGVSASERRNERSLNVRASIQFDAEGPAEAAEHILQILREGIINARRHSDASTVRIQVRNRGPGLSILVEDDGRGFADAAKQPWSILSRVRDIGGELRVLPDSGAGAHLEITVPLEGT